MTASTEQERAEFEKYMLLENYFSERDLVWNGVDGYDCTDADDAFGIWLIARRAQVVPEGYRLQPLSEYDAMCAFISAAPQLPEAACNPSMQPELATKAAPVQLPEPAVPFAVFDCHGFYTEKPNAKQAQAFCDHYNNRDADGGGSAPYTVQALYTEQQVRQLLAAQAKQGEQENG